MKFIQAKSMKEAKENNPGAAKIVKVDGGYMIFATIADYDTWRKQK